VLLALFLLLAGVVVGLIRGGRLDKISAAQFRMPWLVFVALALQVGAQAVSTSVVALQHGGDGRAILTASYALVILFVALNFRYPGTALIGAGLLANLGVILANGAMPVSLSAMHAAGAHALPGLQTGVKHEVMGRATRLRLLSDIIPLPGLGIVSVGDIVLGTGIFLLVQRLVAYQPKRLAGKSPPRRRAGGAGPGPTSRQPPSAVPAGGPEDPPAEIT
jgi:hypothetical protein